MFQIGDRRMLIAVLEITNMSHTRANVTPIASPSSLLRRAEGKKQNAVCSIWREFKVPLIGRHFNVSFPAQN